MIRSTNFRIDSANIDFSVLESEWALYKYEFPNFNFREKNDKDLYAKLIIAYKAQFDYPFYFFSKGKPASFYVLYPVGEPAKEFQFQSFLSDLSLVDVKKPEKVEFAMLRDSQNERGIRDKLHILLKLMQALFLYEAEANPQRRICQSDTYIFAKDNSFTDKSDEAGKGTKVNKYTCVKLFIKFYKNFGNEDEFLLIPSAIDFVETDKSKIDYKNNYHKKYRYFEKIDSVPEYFRQLHPHYIQSFTGEIVQFKKTNIKSKASLDWANSNKEKAQETRSYITLEYQNAFLVFLEKKLLANTVAKYYNVNNEFEDIASKPEIEGYQKGLLIANMANIRVLDNRIKDSITNENINNENISAYIQELNNYYKRKLLVNFEEVTMLEFSSKGYNQPTLIIQDCNGIEFLEKTSPYDNENKYYFLGALGLIDPYKNIYENTNYKEIPKQTININPNEPVNNKNKENYDIHTYKAYFNYSIKDFIINKKEKIEKRKDWLNMLEVCMSELYLKNVIINKLSVLSESFPLLREGSYKYAKNIRKYAWQNDGYFMWIDNNIMQFADLNTNEKEKRKEVLASLGLDWEKIKSKFKQKYEFWSSQDDEETESNYIQTKMKNAYFIFAPNVCAEIEEPEERILYQHDKGFNRKKDSIWGLKDIFYNKNERMYSVGNIDAPEAKISKSIKIRKLDIYFGENEFKPNEFLETMSVEYVRNKQYTVYPYFFDLIRLWAEINS